MTMTRRLFLAGTFAAPFSGRARAQARQSEKVLIEPAVEIGVIRPELHGHFAEHLGTCIYGGLWVGKNSSIPNIKGHRKQAVEWLRALGIPVLRWPGGCFADDYHWRDGIGPVQKRPRRVNIHWGNYTEDNSFGTHEFIELCRLIGAEPYIAGNVGSGTPQEMRDWVEYCNYPSGSSLADERAANGSPEPFRVRYWGVGNENWGCGGNMTPEEYAAHYRRFSTYLRDFGDTRLFLIACGPGGNNLEWTRRFMEAMPRRTRIHGYAMHYYSRGRDHARRFTVESLRAQLATFWDLEKAILEQRALLDKYDKDRRIGLLVDEWGVWDRIDPEEEKRYGRLFQHITMRSALAAALGLNVFHRQADKLVMCNLAQTVNVLHALLLTDGPRCIRTTTYYAFELMKPHRGATAVRVQAPEASPPALSVSASRRQDELIVTLVNPRHDAGLEVECALSRGIAGNARARVLHHPDFNAANTFETPDLIVPRDHPVSASGSSLRVELPPLAIVTVQARLSGV
jgi:alpha-N-arabinofuranosidase